MKMSTQKNGDDIDEHLHRINKPWCFLAILKMQKEYCDCIVSDATIEHGFLALCFNKVSLED
jgi:hypothetical protein